MARIVEAIGGYRSGRLSCVEAAELLGMSERHFRRLRDRYETEGAEGIVDRRRGRVSGRRVAADKIEWVIEQFVTRYFDFTVKHFHEELRKAGFDLSYTWTKTILQQRGLVRAAPKRSAHRKKRQRRPLPGMMLFQDGSTHAWLEGQPPVLRLHGITTIEEANRYLSESYVFEHNDRFAVAAAEEGDAFVPFVGDLAGVLCIKHERVVGNDNCVRFEGLALQIPEQRHRRHYVKAAVQVRQHGDGSMAIYHGPRRLAGYMSDGRLVIEQGGPAKSAA